MMKRILTMIQVCTAALVPLLAASAYAGGLQTLPGINFHAASPEDAGCFIRHGAGGLENKCPDTKTVLAAMPHAGPGWYETSMTVWANATGCRSVALNDVGDISNGGGFRFTEGGPISWRFLHTGWVHISSGQRMSILFECALQSGGVIGNLTVRW